MNSGTLSQPGGHSDAKPSLVEFRSGIEKLARIANRPNLRTRDGWAALKSIRAITPEEASEVYGFLSQLRRLGEDWRYSDEYIGLIVRTWFPRDYNRA